MKWFILPLMLITLVACQDDRERVESANGGKYKVECIDGVEYWLRITAGGHGYMSPRIDPETLDFVLCSVVDNGFD